MPRDLDPRLATLWDDLQKLVAALHEEKRRDFNRRVSTGDLITDRWANAAQYGFGEGTSCYDNVLILGDVKVGCHSWIGPGVILDGQGGLEIGDHCSISAGVQIYSHNTVRRSVSLGQVGTDRASTRIGSGVYIGPNSVIEMGVTIGDRAVIGAMSLVNRDVPADAKAWGCPARVRPPGARPARRRFRAKRTLRR
jgi:acetyltransferase-like isoleucine patch superfamily enzyme